MNNEVLVQRREASAPTETTLILLDGRVVTVKIGESFQVYNSDGESMRLHFGIFSEGNTFHQALFKVICGTLSTHSLKYNVTITVALRHWFAVENFKQEDIVQIDHVGLIAKIPPHYIAFIIPALRRIKDQRLDGISPEVIDFLSDNYKWEERGNGAYYTLITNDPISGALTDQELSSIHSELNYAYSNGSISQEAFTLAWFFIGTGIRPVQAARMLNSDVQITNGAEGKEVTLRIPLAKGEGGGTPEYWIRRAPTVLAECLIEYLDKRDEKSSDAKLFRGTPHAIGDRLTETLRPLNTYSDRLEQRIPVTPYRFRYTLATRALAHGASDFEVARLLTHRSTSCIQFYRASMPQLQNPIREAIGKEMEFFARAFQGRLITSLDESTRAGDEDSVIADFLRLTGQTVGACGTRAECHQNAPIACMYCHHFEPLLDAPWETLMASLKADQDMEKDDRIREINHNAMSAINEIIIARDKKRTTDDDSNG
ncbi:site-specific integrase [Stutzerimonas kunmingensis]|uniref:site-specific integrase n=1 Tax=Stutzerimonas kunmingensis TaxID=1211807 RepID=UPI0028B08BBB|nr:site-specific integrase [Stutzerimonas kunmingensis]